MKRPITLDFELHFKQGFERASEIDFQVRRGQGVRETEMDRGRQCRENVRHIDSKKEKTMKKEVKAGCQIEEREG